MARIINASVLAIGTGLLVFAAAPRELLAERPLVIVGAGAGVGVEPSRMTGQGDVRSALGVMGFEGQVLGVHVGGLFRMVGTLGSIDYQTTGFDRVSFIFAGVVRPFGSWGRAEPDGYVPAYGAWVLSRLAVEVGPLYEWLLAGFTSGHAGGLHFGASVDLPLFSPWEASRVGAPTAGAGPFLRVNLSRPVLFGDTAVLSGGAGSAPIQAGSAVFRGMVSLCVAF